MRKYHQGWFTPTNPKKYAGNAEEIVYRSGWERQLMIKFDTTDSVILWNSEGLAIPYCSPVDGQIHRYFPDFTIKVKDKQGAVKTYLIEVKPFAETQLKPQERQTQRYLTEVATYAVNRAKWAAADAFCKDQGWEFQIVTEKDHPFC